MMIMKRPKKERQSQIMIDFTRECIFSQTITTIWLILILLICETLTQLSKMIDACVEKESVEFRACTKKEQDFLDLTYHEDET